MGFIHLKQLKDIESITVLGDSKLSISNVYETIRKNGILNTPLHAGISVCPCKGNVQQEVVALIQYSIKFEVDAPLVGQCKLQIRYSCCKIVILLIVAGLGYVTIDEQFMNRFKMLSSKMIG